VGLLDHKRTWRYRTRAAPEDCIQAFTEAFRGGSVLAKGKWSISRTASGAVATYEGRGGVIGGLSALSERAMAEREGALGSEVSFEIEERGENGTVCAMWLRQHGTILGAFTNDARFIRPHMRAVGKRLRELDPGLEIASD
jgi:hypothetical protein